MADNTENGRALARIETNQKHILDALELAREGIAQNAKQIVDLKVTIASSAIWREGHQARHVSESKDLKRWLGVGSTLSAVVASFIGVFVDR